MNVLTWPEAFTVVALVVLLIALLMWAVWMLGR